MAKESSSSSSSAPGKCLLEIKKIEEFEEVAKRSAKIGIFDYGVLRVLNRCYDADDDVVEDFNLVEQKSGNQLQYSMQCIELKDELAIYNTLREIHILRHFGTNKYIMSLYSVFRHRQYVALVLPAYFPIRSHLDIRYHFKNAIAKPGSGYARFQEEWEMRNEYSKFMQTWREENYLQTIGLFDRDAVSYVIKKVAKGLDFVHSKGYAHTELCAHNVYMGSRANVKIGGFLHCKQLGSKSRKFTGDPNCLPPECLDENVKEATVDRSIDFWSLGLLTLEIITGKRHYLKEKKAQRLAREYLDGARPLPTLATMDPKTVKGGVQAWHPLIDDFLSRLVTMNPRDRMSFQQVLAHPFITQPVDRREIIRQWKITCDNVSPSDGNRSIFHDMFGAQGSNPSLDEDFLHNIIDAIRHVEKDDYPLFEKVSEPQLIKNYIGIEASVAIPYDDSNWSRDVLDISQRNVYEDEDGKEERSKYKDREEELSDSDDEWDEVRERRRRNDQPPKDEPQLKSGHPAVDKDYQRFEICFFVKKGWSSRERQTFIAMQFARWYQRGVIHFADLIRVVDEIEEVFQNYIFHGTRFTDREFEIPDAVYFASPRRDIRFNHDAAEDRTARYLQHIYVDVAVKPRVTETKLQKFKELMDGDPLEIPEGLATLQASVCFQDVDTQQFEDLEAQMLGQAKMEGWEIEEGQRLADATGPETKFYKLLYERRRCWYMTRNDNYNEGQASNQARCEKIWGDYRRDYIYRTCTWANLPVKIYKPEAEILYGDPFESRKALEAAIKAEDAPEEERLERQIVRTLAKHELDVVEQFKRVEDIDLRRNALLEHEQNFKGQEGYYKLENQLARGKGATTTKFNPLATPAAHGANKINRRI